MSLDVRRTPPVFNALAIWPGDRPGCPPALLAGLAEPRSLRVLIIDDDEGVCAALSRLVAQTYRVECADSARRALELVAGRDFDVLLCDVVMPGVSGADLYDDLSRTRPELVRRLVFMTGGIPSADLARRIRATGCPVIQKPIESAELLLALATHAARGTGPTSG